MKNKIALVICGLSVLAFIGNAWLSCYLSMKWQAAYIAQGLVFVIVAIIAGIWFFASND